MEKDTSIARDQGGGAGQPGSCQHAHLRSTRTRIFSTSSLILELPAAHAWHGASQRGASNTRKPLHVIETQGWHGNLQKQSSSATPKSRGARVARVLEARSQ